MVDGRKSRRHRVRSRGGVPIAPDTDAPDKAPDTEATHPKPPETAAETVKPAPPKPAKPPAKPSAGPSAKPPAKPPPTSKAPKPGPAAKPPPRSVGDDQDRGLRGLVGAGSSAVGVSGAMRARDASRVTDEDQATAERDLVIVRRNWTPPPGEQPLERPRSR